MQAQCLWPHERWVGNSQNKNCHNDVHVNLTRSYEQTVSFGYFCSDSAPTWTWLNGVTFCLLIKPYNECQAIRLYCIYLPTISIDRLLLAWCWLTGAWYLFDFGNHFKICINYQASVKKVPSCYQFLDVCLTIPWLCLSDALFSLARNCQASVQQVPSIWQVAPSILQSVGGNGHRCTCTGKMWRMVDYKANWNWQRALVVSIKFILNGKRLIAF